ncbi:hypothetical protein [Bacillus seohaeanensis]|uniref:Uncharacterized protein n=1 Tax=Bacillus seohaeanensis TaxID=284580 RepID=A0ABW5RS17_9BACI
MYLSTYESQAIPAIHAFWADHCHVEQTFRNVLVKYFTEEWSDKIDLTRPITKHPATKKKEFTLYSVLDILTDFILASGQVAEREQEYPVANADKRARQSAEIRHHEYSLVLDEEHPNNDDDYRTPPYSIEESSLPAADHVMEVLFADSCCEKVEELQDLIAHVKQYPYFYVATYAEEMPEKNRDRKKAEKSIKALDVNRVRECKVCGGAFYAHDLRRRVCDIQKYPKSQDSACEVKNHRNREKNRYLAQKKAII